MKQLYGKHGVTLVEVMLVVTILSIISLAVVPFISVSQRGFASNEVNNTLKINAQQVINKIAVDLTQCKRLFENSASDTAFLSRVTFSTAPAALTGSLMARKEENGSISPSTSSFVASSVGNELFYANINPPIDLTVNDSGAVARNVRIDVYQFNYYYLASNAAISIANQSQLQLWEWHSLLYADYNQLVGISDATKKTNTAIGVYNRGIRWAWDPSATAVTSAFYSIGSGGAIAAASAHQIQFGSAKLMFQLLTGLSGNSFRYGVSPNTGGSYSIRQTVPQFATASGSFPSGFEVVTVGPNSARQVFLRLVMTAQGAFKGYMSDEETVLITVRDLW